jgi:hypothetical protein
LKTTIKEKTAKTVDQILEAFEKGDLPEAIAYSTFTPPENIPAAKWSRHNRALAFLQGTGDARGFNQWKAAGRSVKKGSHAIHILGPYLVKKGKNEKDEDELQCIGYYGIPVFRVEDTEGDELDYIQFDTKTLPLANVAAKWGLEVKSGAFTEVYYAYYSNNRKEIVMATKEETVFYHELAHAAHYRIDPDIGSATKLEKEVIAELSAAALARLAGKHDTLGNHFNYIKGYAAAAKLTPVKACMKVLDKCISVIELIIAESEKLEKIAA